MPAPRSPEVSRPLEAMIMCPPNRISKSGFRNDGERPVCKHEPLHYAIKKAKDGFAGGYNATVWDEQDPSIALVTRGRDVLSEGPVQAEMAHWSMILWAPILDSLQDGVAE